MSRFNFDPEFFRKIISGCTKTEEVPFLPRIIKEAVEAFYDEFDYYPDLGAYAPGAFTIMGDHLEYADGYLVQAASPFATVIVGKSLNSTKCKVSTTSKDVDGLRRIVFPIVGKDKGIQSYPEWITFIKGVIKNYPAKGLTGFDALIHSNVPRNKGYGSSAALQVAFYSFLEATCGKTSNKSPEKMGLLCRQAEMETNPCRYRVGRWENLTSAVAKDRTGVLINCSKAEASTFDMREIDILFLLIYPNFEIERIDRDLIPRRNMELQLIARLLGLDHIREARPKHLKIFEKMEDPSREFVIEILRGLGIDEDTIFEFVDELFYFPKPPSIGNLFYGEAEEEYVGFNVKPEYSEETFGEAREEDNGYPVPCMGYEKVSKWMPRPRTPQINYLDQKLMEICKEKLEPGLDVKICQEINCLGGIENLSVESDLSVIGRLLRRLRHVITERERCIELPDIIERGDYVEFGSKLIQSHLSLKIDFAVSCPTLDSMVMFAIESEKVLGAKMMSGGGMLALIHRNNVEEFIEKFKEKFESSFQFYLMFPYSGAKILNLGVKQNPKSVLSNKYLNKTELMRKAVQNFEATYKYRPSHGAYSPGVLNLIGDHSDYNHGLAVSMGVSLLTVVVGAFNGTSKIRVATTADVDDEPQKVIFPLPIMDDLPPGKIKWVRIIKGVISNFEGDLQGFDCIIENNIPSNSGIPNQTVLVVAFYTFLEELTGQKTDFCRKAYLCMLTEHDFANTTRGAGDHTVLLRTKQEHALLLDCRSLTSTLIPFQDTSVSLVLTFTKQKAADVRCLLYCRMEECYDVAKALGAKTLRCLTMKQLNDIDKSKVSEKSIRRAKHVILENERVLRSAEALKNNDFEALGELMVASHNSLRYNYEVTTPELDFLVERAMEVDGVLGSKMLSSGQASCILSLVKLWAVDDLIEYLQINYSESLDCYIVTPHSGCGSLNVKEYVDSLPSTQFAFEDIFPF